MRVFVGFLLTVSIIIASWLALVSFVEQQSAAAWQAAADSAVYIATGVYLSIVAASVVLVFANLASSIHTATTSHIDSLNALKFRIRDTATSPDQPSSEAGQQMLSDAMTLIDHAKRRSPVLVAGRGSVLLVTKVVGAIVATSVGTVLRRVLQV